MTKVRKTPPLATDTQSFTRLPSGEVVPVKEGPPKPTPVWLQRGFYRNFAFEKVNYYAREWHILWPGVLGQTVIYQQAVPQNMALVLTSVKFRATVLTLIHPTDVIFVRDDYLLHLCAFRLEIGGQPPYDSDTINPMTLAQSPITRLLNNDLNIIDLPFQLVAGENQLVRAVLNVEAMPPAWVAPASIGVEMRGLWVPTVVWNEMSAKMGLG